jgi:hypothetical protein
MLDRSEHALLYALQLRNPRAQLLNQPKKRISLVRTNRYPGGFEGRTPLKTRGLQLILQMDGDSFPGQVLEAISCSACVDTAQAGMTTP